MNTTEMMSQVESVYAKAMPCKKCFDEKLGRSAYIDVPQPRWVGSKYFQMRTKVVIMAINPGAGTPDKQLANQRFRDMLYQYRDGKANLRSLFEFEKDYMQEWGTPSGKFLQFYCSGMGLRLDEIAFANIAWCAERKNKPSAGMLNQCFDLHTVDLLLALQPNAVILAGSLLRRFSSRILAILPSCRVIETFNHAHREGEAREHEELQSVRSALINIRK